MKINELGKSSNYRKPIGMMEMYKFMQIATPEQKIEMRKLIDIVKGDDKLRAKKAEQDAWKLLQSVTNAVLAEVNRFN